MALVAVALALASANRETTDDAADVPTASEPPAEPAGERSLLCAAVAHLQEGQEPPPGWPADKHWETPTDPEAIANVVQALPPAMKVEASLRYSPYGGDIPPGVDTSGTRAQQAVERLEAFYREECGQ